MNEAIYRLEETAKKILELKNNSKEKRLRKPLVIEFCGIPKSGKTTSINALNTFLKRNNFKTKVLTERASICPITKKTHPNFNLWTITRTLSELIENLFEYAESTDIILADRAVFDSLIWFEWLNNNPSPCNPHLDKNTYEAIIGWLTTEYITRNIDLVLLFNSTPEKAMQREYSCLLTNKKGSIMNDSVLLGYVEAQKKVMEKYRCKFGEIVNIDDNKLDGDMSKKNLQVTKIILNKLEELVEEKVLFFDLDRSLLKDGVITYDEFAKMMPVVRFDNRTTVENNWFLHPVPVAIFTDKEKKKVLVLKKNQSSVSKFSAEKDRLLLYSGGHVRKEDAFNLKERFTIDDCKEVFDRTLSREIYEELNESITVSDVEPFIVYSSLVEGSQKHVAFCYVIEVDDLDNKKFNPISYEHIKKTGTSKSGRVMDVETIFLSDYKELEDWSKYIMQEVFNIEYQEDIYMQLPLQGDYKYSS